MAKETFNSPEVAEETYENEALKLPLAVGGFQEETTSINYPLGFV